MLCEACHYDVPLPGSDLCSACQRESELEEEDRAYWRDRRAAEEALRADAVREVAG